MEQLLALRLADLTRPITVGIISPSDKHPVLVAAWKGAASYSARGGTGQTR